jgi:Family of unknown function (DUF6527)
MTLFGRTWSYPRRYLTGLFSRYFGSTFRMDVVEELPAKLNRRTLHVITEHDVHIQASMICPDGCGTVINLNLLPDDHPVWRLSADYLCRPTLYPFGWRREGCGARFFLRKGQLVWV